MSDVGLDASVLDQIQDDSRDALRLSYTAQCYLSFSTIDFLFSAVLVAILYIISQ